MPAQAVNGGGKHTQAASENASAEGEGGENQEKRRLYRIIPIIEIEEKIAKMGGYGKKEAFPVPKKTRRIGVELGGRTASMSEGGREFPS